MAYTHSISVFDFGGGDESGREIE